MRSHQIHCAGMFDIRADPLRQVNIISGILIDQLKLNPADLSQQLKPAALPQPIAVHAVSKGTAPPVGLSHAVIIVF